MKLWIFKCSKCITNAYYCQRLKPSLFCITMRKQSSMRTQSINVSYKILEPISNEDSPILMAHGVMGNKMNFNSMAKKLHDETGRMVITYDARNHGKSPHASNMTLNDMASDAIDLLDYLKVDQCVFVGHSMGGRVAMYTALSHPRRLDKLVVVDSSPSMSTSRLVAGSMTKYVEAMKAVNWDDIHSISDARQHADWLLKDSISDSTIRSFLLTNVVEMPNGSFGWRVNLDAIEHHIENTKAVALSESMQPYTGDTLFIGGGNSKYITEEDYPDIRKLFPKSIISHIPNCGHWVHSEKPTEFLVSVLTFLKPDTISLF